MQSLGSSANIQHFFLQLFGFAQLHLLVEDAELCFCQTPQAMDAEYPFGDGDVSQGTLIHLQKLAETAKEHQAWCELPFGQLAYNFATNGFGEKSVDSPSSAENLIVVYLRTGFADKAQQIAESLLETAEDKFGDKTHL